MTRIVAVAARTALLSAVLLAGRPAVDAAAYRHFFEIGERACAQGPENVIGSAGLDASVQFAINPIHYPPSARNAFAAGCRAANLGQ
jgi:hypothetical protein